MDKMVSGSIQTVDAFLWLGLFLHRLRVHDGEIQGHQRLLHLKIDPTSIISLSLCIWKCGAVFLTL